MKKLTLLAAVASLLPLTAFSAEQQLEEMLVSASRTPMSTRETGSSVSVLDAEAIEARGAVAIQDVLRTLPSIAVSNSGGLGKQSALRIRGEESYRTLVLVDGIDYSDPTTTQVQTQVQHLLASDIERIEVLRGPQGMMYGADAGGVINIITRKGEGAPQGSLSAETGRYGTQKLTAALRGQTGILDYSANASRVETDGFNARVSDTVLRDDDGYENDTVGLNLGIKITEKLRAEVSGRQVESENEFDGCFAGTTVHNCVGHFQQDTLKGSLIWSGERISQRLSYQKQALERENFAAATQSFLAEGGVDEIQYYGAITLSESYQLIFGIDDEEQYIDSSTPEQTRDNQGIYAELQARLGDDWHLSLGARQDDNEDFGKHDSYRLTTAYIIAIGDAAELKLRGSYGTGFRAPSLFEVAFNASATPGSAAANTVLKEETSEGYDVGIDWLFGDGAQISVGYFDQTIEDAIEFDLNTFSGYLQPAGESESRGWEVSAELPLEPRTTLIANYTWNDTEDTAGNQRTRRPKEITNIGVDHRIPDIGVTAFLNYLFVRDAVDNGMVELPDYQVLDATINWAATDSLDLYVRAENLTGADYQEITGFNVAGASTYVGVRFDF